MLSVGCIPELITIITNTTAGFFDSVKFGLGLIDIIGSNDKSGGTKCQKLFLDAKLI